MFFEIKDLELHPIEFAEKFEPGAIDLGSDYRQISPVETSGRADLVEEHHGKHKIIKDIRIQGRLATSLESECARCLEPLTQDVTREFDLLYRPAGADAGRDEISVTDAELRSAIMKARGSCWTWCPGADIAGRSLETYCRDDCKGLCPHCGKNMNLEKCSCAVTWEEPRGGAQGNPREAGALETGISEINCSRSERPWREEFIQCLIRTKTFSEAHLHPAAHDALKSHSLSECPNCHEKKMPHRACSSAATTRPRRAASRRSQLLPPPCLA